MLDETPGRIAFEPVEQGCFDPRLKAAFGDEIGKGRLRMPADRERRGCERGAGHCVAL